MGYGQAPRMAVEATKALGKKLPPGQARVVVVVVQGRRHRMNMCTGCINRRGRPPPAHTATIMHGVADLLAARCHRLPLSRLQISAPAARGATTVVGRAMSASIDDEAAAALSRRESTSPTRIRRQRLSREPTLWVMLAGWCD